MGSGKRGSGETKTTVISIYNSDPGACPIPNCRETYTVSDAINIIGYGRFQWMLCILTGICWMADSMEMMILSILSPVLHCEWNIDQYQQAFITTAVFIGMMISSPLWGFLSDKYGRKMMLWVSVSLLYVFGTISAFSVNYIMILAVRGLVGFAIGCVPQSVTLYSEFLPTSARAKSVVFLNCFWALGGCAEVLLALVVMPTLGWRWLLALSALPLLFFCILCFWLPESVRFYAATGNVDKVERTLQRISNDNGKPLPTGKLIIEECDASQRGRFADLFKPQIRTTTFLLWFIWLTCAFCYYGSVLMSSEILSKFAPKHTDCVTSHDIHLNGTNEDHLQQLGNHSFVPLCENVCRIPSSSEYLKILWTTLAEFPGLILTVIGLDFIGRKKTMALQLAMFSISVFCFCFTIESTVVVTVLLFIARGSASGAFQAAYVYTPEVYSTSMRAIGIGTCSCLARVGAMSTPFVAQVLLKASLSLGAGVYGAIALAAAIVALILPIETKGKELPDSVIAH